MNIAHINFWSILYEFSYFCHIAKLCLTLVVSGSFGNTLSICSDASTCGVLVVRTYFRLLHCLLNYILMIMLDSVMEVHWTYLDNVIEQTNFPDYQGAEKIVIRRYSDFVWLRDRLFERYKGIFVPPLPEKNAVGTGTKVIVVLCSPTNEHYIFNHDIKKTRIYTMITWFMFLLLV